MTEKLIGDRKSSGRLQFLLIAAVFIGPLIVAAWLYFGGSSLSPGGRTNHGSLLSPIVNLADALPESAIHDAAPGEWLLLYMNEDSCETDCREALYAMRQMRLMLGAEMDRVGRIFLHGHTPPDRVFPADFLATEHAGLVTLEDGQLSALLASRQPAGEPKGGWYLVDPQGNLVMYFSPALAPGDIVSDMKRLLRLSRIG